jgi:hypothetical protein
MKFESINEKVIEFIAEMQRLGQPENGQVTNKAQ